MTVNHDLLVWLSKSVGLLYMMAFFIGVLIYAYWPANRARFDLAARSIVEKDEDRPWR